ncbi:extracellular substrate-binding protein [Bordetella pertussis]|uniref:Extracellular solute-binding protein n=4 Tax=Bordetella pertussis TaxID=520 RepID=Q7VX79_BORPE|nr:ABC transporter substrate-binding protein [Bordetella pertussis]ETH37352.1 ABC transporter, solute-binding protein [Bordetella pertussis H918]ETH44983.1 ABC transporter, solute-binding protein [Bordetella pertussis H939]ETH45554.1 ABC transporter, solute-binding protein [Bordetella pertussis H921]ETH69827.1 ABC transporter, solute-binding protein [Bordetella pertussis STO1-CHLA-0011]ETH83830.1 ABC transporter, solute-binding protein [Bordetella pertussis STO1-CHOC-0017]ETH85825.1 ABC trans
MKMSVPQDGWLADAAELALQSPGLTSARRRQLLGMLGAAGLASLAPMRPAAAAADRIVVYNWGGDAIKNQPLVWGKPYEKATGTKVEFDGTGPSFGKIRTMVESRNVAWDVCDANLAAGHSLGKRGYLEPIDYSVVDRNKVRPGFSSEFGVSHFIYSFVLTYDKKAFGDRPPRTWADFWNTKDFPGTRILPDRVLATLEAALMADGVPADASQLYPIDERRALDKIAAIKDKTIFWKTGAESQQLLRQGEATMGLVWHTRATVMRREPGSTIDFTWNQGILIPAGWLVPKGNPAGRKVFDFIASTQSPESQIELLRLMGNGPANPAANALVPPELRQDNPTDEENFRQQVVANYTWHGDNQDRIYNEYVKVITG